jgi:hypothetical protein
LTEKQKVRVVENRVLQNIFWPTKDMVRGDWRRLHNEQLHGLYCSPKIIRAIKRRRMRWTRHAARMGVKLNSYRVFVGKPEGKRPLGRSQHRWEYKIE